MKKFKSLPIFLSLAMSSISSIAVATQCPDIQVQVRNHTERTIAGGVWGNSGNLGSSGYFTEPYAPSTIGVYSQNYPQGDRFGLVGNIQWFGETYEYANCTLDVQGINGCPDPQAATFLDIYEGADGLAWCHFNW